MSNFMIRLNEKDRGRLLFLLFLFSIAALVAFFWILRSFVPGSFVLLAVILFQQFWVLPKVYLYYRKILSLESSPSCYIPLWNNIAHFGPTISLITLIVTCVQTLLLVLLVTASLDGGMLATVAESIFGPVVAMTLSFYLVMYSILVYFVLNIVTGMGYSSIKRTVDQMYVASFGKIVWNGVERVQYILFFIPIVRIYALFLLQDRLRKMCMVQNLGQADTDQFEIEGEFINV